MNDIDNQKKYPKKVPRKRNPEPQWCIDQDSNLDNRTCLFNSLKSHRNFYFISRFKPLEYHVNGRVIENSEEKMYHFAGKDPLSIKMCSTIIRGPCCDWHQLKTNFQLYKCTGDSDPLVNIFLQEAHGKLRAMHSPTASIQVTFEGCYESVTVTEFIVQDESEGLLAQDMRKDILSQLQNIRSKPLSQANSSNNIREMDIMDLECMLSCLPHQNKDSSELIIDKSPGDRAVSTASMVLCLDKEGNILNKDYWEENHIVTALTRLEDLSPKQDSYWMDYTPKNPGSLQLAYAKSVADVSEIVASCQRTVKDIVRAHYSNPLPLLLYLQGNESLPMNYVQKKVLYVSIDVFQNGIHQFKKSCHIVLNMHEAYHNPPYIARSKILDSRITLQAEVYLRDQTNLRLQAKKSSGDLLGEGECTFQTTFSVTSSGLVHVSSMPLCDGEISFHLPACRNGSNLDADITISNGQLVMC